MRKSIYIILFSFGIGAALFTSAQFTNPIIGPWITSSSNFKGTGTTSAAQVINTAWPALIGTTTAFTTEGQTQLFIYGTTTIQTPFNTLYAFRILNKATSSVFSVDTLNGSTTIGMLNVATSTATSTFTNGIQLLSGCFRLPSGSCAGTGGGSGITTLNGLTTDPQSFATTNGSAAWLQLLISSSGSTHTFTLTGTTSPAWGFFAATSTGATSSVIYGLDVGNTIRSSSLIATSSLTVGSDYLTDITGSGLSISGNALTCNTASGSVFGCLASADWTTFNNKLGSLNGLTGTTQTFSATNVAPSSGRYATLTITSTGTNHNFTIEASSSPTYGFLAATTSLAVGTSTPARLFSVNGDALLGTVYSTSTLNIYGLGTSTYYGALQVSSSTATSTFSGALSATLLRITSTTASSTFSGGIVVAGGAQFSTYNCSNYTNGGKLTTDANGYLACGADTSTGGAVTVNTGAANSLAFYSGASTVDSSNYLSTLATGGPVGSGRLGIGTSTPFAILHVSATSTPQLILTDFPTNTANVVHWFASTTIGNLRIGTIGRLNTATTTFFTIASTTGSVGIGTTTPAQLLSVQGNELISGTSTVGSLIATSTLYVGGTTGRSLYVAESGNVGIGTTSPSGIFAVQMTASSDISAPKFWMQGMTSGQFAELSLGDGLANYRSAFLRYIQGAGVAANSRISLFNYGDAESLTVVGGGNVGIGTTTPAGILSVQNASGRAMWFNDANSRPTLHFENGATTALIDVISGGRTAFYTEGATSLMLGTNNTDRLTIDSTGNVGIGTTSPMDKLSVVGNIAVTGCVRNAANGTLLTGSPSCVDIAEAYTAGEDILPGDLVAIAEDTSTPEGFVIVKATSTSAVIGAVSSRPAVFLQGETAFFGGSHFTASSTFARGSETPLALVGRVPVTVSLENGPIGVGDPITLGSEAGVGKRTTESGRIIGYALEPFSGTIFQNKAKIMVFLNPSTWFPENYLANMQNQIVNTSLLSSSGLMGMFVETLKTLGIWIKNGMVQITNLVVNTLTVKEKLCIGNTCVTENQLKELLKKNSITGSMVQPTQDVQPWK